MSHHPICNFWIEIDIDGRKSRFFGARGFWLTVHQRDHDHMTRQMSVLGTPQPDGSVVLSLVGPSHIKAHAVTRPEKKR